jgi:hypothetical protein
MWEPRPYGPSWPLTGIALPLPTVLPARIKLGSNGTAGKHITMATKIHCSVSSTEAVTWLQLAQLDSQQ